MGINICPSCSERLTRLTQKCPKCGIIIEKSISPVMIVVGIVVFLLSVVIAGLILF